MRASVGRDSSPALAIDAPSSGLLLHSLWVSPRESSARAITRGTVRSVEEKPIAGARLSVRGNASTVTSDASGAFALPASPLGTRMLDIEAVGFQSQHIPINILSGDVAALNIELSPHLPTLATVRVTARMTAINERRNKHLASFLDDSTIARRRPGHIADAVRGMPGVLLINADASRGTFSERRAFASRATDPGTFGDRIMLGTPRKSCEPAVFVDGVRQRVTTTGDVDALVDVQEIRTIELYRWGWEVPQQFDAPTECGALLIWRK
ncbi:carboxypeptidase-like regulatory domain-containing protein [Gemmatimonas groenlandica]|nr:carboxypeptidase regulatory-like domain-containing protein [Gemmatimonas groenlandica]